MNNVISYNEKILENYQKKYPNLVDFSYDLSTDSLIYHGNAINLNGYGLSRIDEVFFNMESDDIYTYIKNGYYQDSLNTLIYVENLLGSDTKKLLLSSDDERAINTFVHDFYVILDMWNRNKEAFGEVIPNSFAIVLQRGKNIINTARNNSTGNLVLNTINDALNNELNDNNNIEEQTNSNALSQGVSRTRTNGSINKYARIFKENEERLNEPQSYGMAGFTSIILVVSAAVVFGMYLAITLIG